MHRFFSRQNNSQYIELTDFTSFHCHETSIQEKRFTEITTLLFHGEDAINKIIQCARDMHEMPILKETEQARETAFEYLRKAYIRILAGTIDEKMVAFDKSIERDSRAYVSLFNARLLETVNLHATDLQLLCTPSSGSGPALIEDFIRKSGEEVCEDFQELGRELEEYENELKTNAPSVNSIFG